MPIIRDPHLYNEQSLFVDLEGVARQPDRA